MFSCILSVFLCADGIEGEKEMRFIYSVIAALLILIAGMIFRGGISFGGEEVLAMAILVWAAVREVRDVSSK